MELLKDILLYHLKKYPEMQLTDIIKLVYQNEFGSGHMLDDESESLARLVKEWNNTRCTPDNTDDIFDNIGNGLCRLNLSAAKAAGLCVNTLNRFFLITANSHTGTISSFERKLDILVKLCSDKALPFDSSELELNTSEYKEKGCPAVSHSETYRRHYSPAYRVVKKVYCDFFPLFCKIDVLLASKPNPVIAIDGNAGAGKSFLAGIISEVYDCNIVHMDHFFLPLNKRTTARLSEIGGNIDYERFSDEVIGRIFLNEVFSYRIFDCSIMDFRGTVRVNPSKMTVVEGSYSLHPYFGNVYDLKVFLSADPETQKKRILERNGVQMLEKFITLWIPMENEYFKMMRIPEKCDLVFKC